MTKISTNTSDCCAEKEVRIHQLQQLIQEQTSVMASSQEKEREARFCLQESEEQNRILETSSEDLKSRALELEQQLNQAKQDWLKLKGEEDMIRSRREEEEEKKEILHRRMSERQEAIESDLRRQISGLNSKLQSTLQGCRSESEMASESVLKVVSMEATLVDLKQCIQDLECENAELKEQLSIALEQHTTKSSGSVGSDSGDSTQKTTSSGIGSDLSDCESEVHPNSRSSSPHKQIHHHDDELPHKHDELLQADHRHEEYEPDQKSLQEQNSELETTVEALKRDKSALNSEIIYLKEDLRLLKEDRNEEITKLNEDINNRNAELRKLQEQQEHREEEWQKLSEDKCELEELENDTRLRCQTLESEVEGLKAELARLRAETNRLRSETGRLREERRHTQEKDEYNTQEINYLDNVLRQYEHKLTGMERKEVKLTRALHSLVTSVTIWSFYHHHSFCLYKVPALTYIAEVHSKETQTVHEEPSYEKDSLELCGENVASSHENLFSNSENDDLNSEHISMLLSENENLHDQLAQISGLNVSLVTRLDATASETDRLKQKLNDIQEEEESRKEDRQKIQEDIDYYRRRSERLEGQQKSLKSLLDHLNLDLDEDYEFDEEPLVGPLRALVNGYSKQAIVIDDHVKKVQIFNL